jgi:hypothetical protein
MSIKLLDVIMLESGIPQHGLMRGDIGAVVELYNDGALEVEFVMVGGYTKALITLVPGQFSPLDPQDMLSVRRLNAA